jgi:hypothetical protein
MRNDALSTAMVATMSAARTANNKTTVPARRNGNMGGERGTRRTNFQESVNFISSLIPFKAQRDHSSRLYRLSDVRMVVDGFVGSK